MHSSGETLSDRISAGQKENVRTLCFNHREIEQYWYYKGYKT